jgi:hypothetical protein
MVQGLDNNQIVENFRIRLELSHQRIREMASYIRLADAAIWGFLGFAFIELFKDNLDLIIWKIPLFLSFIVISMFLWREIVKNYQVDIVLEYRAIMDYEAELQMSDVHSLTVRQKDKWKDDVYTDPIHEKYDKFAKTMMWIAFIVLIAWVVFFLLFWLISSNQQCFAIVQIR